MATEDRVHLGAVMEAGFKIIPGKEAEFFNMQGKMVPVGASQPGFVSVYGGPILDSTWLYFGVRFSDAGLMDAWHHHPQHQAVQKMAYDKWWTAVYIRKWRQPAAGDTSGRRMMCETRLAAGRALDAGQIEKIRGVLAHLAPTGASRFETLTGEYESQPYQFVGPLEIAPTLAGAVYSLITHWSSGSQLEAWLQSAPYRQMSEFGQLTSETFVELEEAGIRNNLRDDKLQRQWTLAVATGPA